MKDATPSKEVQDELDEMLRSIYPKLHHETQANEEADVAHEEAIAEVDRWYRSVQYSVSHSELTATVTFHRGQKTLNAIFRYKERKPNQREKSWYCEQDWND